MASSSSSSSSSWSLRQRLKTRLFSLPEDIAAGVKHLSSANVATGLPSFVTQGTESASPVYEGNAGRRARARLEAGSDLLSYYQDKWEEMHVANEKNAKAAAACDADIKGLRTRVEKQWGDVSTLQMLLANAPKINEQIEGAMASLGALESSFSDVEVALLALEDTIDATDLQRRQREERRQVQMYQERRKAEFNELSNRLHSDYARKKQESERREALRKQQTQVNYQRKFEEDLATYSSRPDFLQVPRRRDPDASLETVDLDEDEDGGLEAFLGDVPEASPLPTDDEGVPRVTVGDGRREVEDDGDSTESSERTRDGGQGQKRPPTDVADGDNGGSLCVSRAESMYYTPNDTLENIVGAVEEAKLED